MKIDMHVHTKYSYDGVSEVEDIFEYADKRGLDGVAITDHFDNRAWEKAEEVAEEKDMVFIPSEEIRILDKDKKTIGEVLMYFMEHGMGNKTMKEIRKEVDEQNSLIFLAHPYARARPSPPRVEDLVEYVDGLEVINSRARLNKTNRKAFNKAEELDLAMVGGSDAHIPEEIGHAYTEVKEASTLDEFRKGLEEKKSVAKGGITNALLHYTSQIKGRI